MLKLIIGIIAILIIVVFLIEIFTGLAQKSQTAGVCEGSSSVITAIKETLPNIFGSPETQLCK